MMTMVSSLVLELLLFPELRKLTLTSLLPLSFYETAKGSEATG